jgi:Asp-tRNA(Asn)/Glu-tRNA(Gln) amidotransferase A subunit family amidase
MRRWCSICAAWGWWCWASSTCTKGPWARPMPTRLTATAINPWRAGFTPGGSSGGSAAAVRAQLCAAAIGTDTMGSVRVPASYCGVTAYKPSAGRVPNQGVVPLCHMLDTVGWLTASVADAQALAASLWPSAQGSPTVLEASPSMATVSATASASASTRPLRVGRLVQADQVSLGPGGGAGLCPTV